MGRHCQPRRSIFVSFIVLGNHFGLSKSPNWLAFRFSKACLGPTNWLCSKRAELISNPDRSVTKTPDFFAQQSKDLQLAAQAALAAGQIIKDGYDRSHEIDAKGVGDLVSQVDFDADRVATDILSKAYPDTTIISEELNPDAGDAQTDAWVIDPLDGTTAYLMKAGLQFSSVLIAKREAGETSLGVVYFPLTGEWFYAARGQGAFKNGQALKLEQRDWQLGECWVEMNQYGNIAYETPFFAAAKNALRSNKGAQIVTSTFPHAGIAMRILEQKSGLAIAIHDNNPADLKQGPWDIAANQVIFEEAGGVFCNPAGGRTCPFRAEPILIAPCKKLAEQVCSLVSATI